jgi:hypothetical protein
VNPLYTCTTSRQVLEPEPMWGLLMSVHKASLDMPSWYAKTLYSPVTGTSINVREASRTFLSHSPCIYTRVRCCNCDLMSLSWSTVQYHAEPGASGVARSDLVPICITTYTQVSRYIEASCRVSVPCQATTEYPFLGQNRRIFPHYSLRGGESSC